MHRSQLERTLTPQGERVQVAGPTPESRLEHRWELGLTTGDFGGANLVSATGSYALTQSLHARLDVTHLLGSYSNGWLVTAGLLHAFMPQWRVSPFVSLGGGVVHISPKATIVQSEDRTDPAAYSGLGVRGFLTEPLPAAGGVPEVRRLDEPRRQRGDRRMDRGLHVLLLSAAALGGVLAAGTAAAQDPVVGASETPQVVEPQVERRAVKAPKIDTENFEVGGFVGTIAIEDFGSSMTYGARAAYHFTEDLFAEATVGTSTAGRTSYEDLSGSVELLTDSQREFTYYDLSLGWNALPGEVFFGGRRAMPSAVYLSLGGGSTRFAGDDNFTLVVGAGFRLLVTDSLAAHLTVRDQMFESDLLGSKKLTQNLQFSFGLTAFF